MGGYSLMRRIHAAILPPSPRTDMGQAHSVRNNLLVAPLEEDNPDDADLAPMTECSGSPVGDILWFQDPTGFVEKAGGIGFQVDP